MLKDGQATLARWDALALLDPWEQLVWKDLLEHRAVKEVQVPQERWDLLARLERQATLEQQVTWVLKG